LDLLPFIIPIRMGISLCSAVALVAVVILDVTAAPIAKVGGGAKFPVYKQCDDRWGNHTMGVVGDGERATICREGCAMSCLAAALSVTGFVIPGAAAGTAITPGSLNDYLVANKL
jgi:hypothetical protein